MLNMALIVPAAGAGSIVTITCGRRHSAAVTAATRLSPLVTVYKTLLWSCGNTKRFFLVSSASTTAPEHFTFSGSG